MHQMRHWAGRLIAACAILAGASAPAGAQMRGHGGPVRAVAVSPEGTSVLSGSFDSSAILWSLPDGSARQVLRAHDTSVNAVVFLPNGRPVTAGEDGRIAVWPMHGQGPPTLLGGHQGPIAALAVSSDGGLLASASWDQTVRLWPLAGGEPRVLSGHTQNVNAVAFMPDGRHVVSGGYDATIRIWETNGEGRQERLWSRPGPEGSPPQGGSPLHPGGQSGGTVAEKAPRAKPDEPAEPAPTSVVQLPTPVNALTVAPDGEIVAGGADGKLRFLSAEGRERGELAVGETPVIAVAVSPDGRLVAAAGIRGAVAIVDRAHRSVERTLVGPGLPVWSLSFAPDSRTLITGGADRMVRRWDAATGEHVGTVPLAAPDDRLAAYAGDRGAEVFRACIACHSLTAGEGDRAGPTLAGIFGRKIASLSGYPYSRALRQMDIVWTPETVARLFEVGPTAYTPGTKMPEQRITSAEDRAALVDFLTRATTQ